MGAGPHRSRAGDVARDKVSLSELCSDGDAVYWLESRPGRGGPGGHGAGRRSGSVGSLARRASASAAGSTSTAGARCAWCRDGRPAPSPTSTRRTSGCGSATAPQAPDRSAARLPCPCPTTPPAGEVHRHGGLSATADGDWVLAVREVHREGAARPRRSVVALSTRTRQRCETRAARRHDFFGTPRPHPDGDRLAVVAWDHPDMPWDASALFVLPLARVACAAHGHDAFEAAGPARTRRRRSRTSRSANPRGAATGRCGSSRIAGVGGSPTSMAEAPRRAGGAQTADRRGSRVPRAGLGARSVHHGGDGRRHAGGPDDGVGPGHARVVGPARPGRGTSPVPLTQPCVSIAAVCAHGDGVALIGSHGRCALQRVGLAPARRCPSSPPAARRDARRRRRRHRGALHARPGARSAPCTARCTGPTWAAPRRARRAARPPLVVWCHGGPTASCQAGLDLTVQFFTTRGFAVACVDYAGSSGYGRAYRCALWGQWGVVDSEDCLDAALHLAARGDVDPERMAVRGGSAGGMTALNALAAGRGSRPASRGTGSPT